MTRCNTASGQHAWIKGVGQTGYCVYCNEQHVPDTSVDWDKPHEPGPVKIVPQSEERALAERDERLYGIGFLIDGKHVDPSRVVVLNSKLRGATDSVEEIIRDLVDLAHGEGIADPIIERARAYLETLPC